MSRDLYETVAQVLPVLLLALVFDMGLCVLMLAGGVTDSVPLRAVVVTGVMLALVALLFRISVDVLDATRESETHTGSGD